MYWSFQKHFFKQSISSIYNFQNTLQGKNENAE